MCLALFARRSILFQSSDYSPMAIPSISILAVCQVVHYKILKCRPLRREIAQVFRLPAARPPKKSKRFAKPCIELLPCAGTALFAWFLRPWPRRPSLRRLQRLHLLQPLFATLRKGHFQANVIISVGQRLAVGIRSSRPTIRRPSPGGCEHSSTCRRSSSSPVLVLARARFSRAFARRVGRRD